MILGIAAAFIVAGAPASEARFRAATGKDLAVLRLREQLAARRV